MVLKSTFEEDLNKEQKLQSLLDHYYSKYLRNYNFRRVNDLQQQREGVDLILVNKTTNEEFIVDEKAQLDYVNDDLPTFAFELSYYKKGKLKSGWLSDSNKRTHFYSLVTAIYQDEPDKFTSCKITFVNRKKLLQLLEERNLSFQEFLNKQLPHGKSVIEQFHHRKEGYLYSSISNKAEKPLNLILKLDFLIEHGVAKRLV